MIATQPDTICHVCGIPADASYFDDSSIVDLATVTGPEVVLAKYELHPNYCGELLYFAQFTDAYAANPAEVVTPDLQWQIRSDGQPLAPWLTFDRIINPWGLSGFPIHLRLREGSLTELVVRFVGEGSIVLVRDLPTVTQVGGRLLGRLLVQHELRRTLRSEEAQCTCRVNSVWATAALASVWYRKRSRFKKLFCTDADLEAIGAEMGKGRGLVIREVRTEIEDAVRRARVLIERAESQLKKPRATGQAGDAMRERFRDAFGRNPEFVPTWRPAGQTWDVGGVVRERLRCAAKIMSEGRHRVCRLGSS